MTNRSRAYYVVRSIVRAVVVLTAIAALLALVGLLNHAMPDAQPFTYGTH